MKKKGIIGILVFFAMVMQGFSSCTVDNEGIADEDRVPQANYHFSGKVTDESGAPLKGIQVIARLGEMTPSFTRDTMYTDASGKYEKQDTFLPYNSADVTFNDIDGAENGGEFESFTIKVMTKPFERGNGASFSGSFLVEADAVLKKK